jgi:hypothetical protein
MFLGCIRRFQLRARLGRPWPDHTLSPHRSHRADFHAAGSSDATPRPVPRMGDPRKQQRMATEEFYIFLPRQFLPASSATEPLPPDMADGPIELPDASGVRRSSVISVVAPELGVEGRLLFVYRLGSPGTLRLLPSGPFGAVSSSSARSL